MIDIEVRGIPCVFNEDALADFETLENLADMQDGNSTAMVRIGRRLFGDEQLVNIRESLRGEGGFCHIREMEAFISECIVEAAKVKRSEAKN